MGLLSTLFSHTASAKSAKLEETIGNWLDATAENMIALCDEQIEAFHADFPNEITHYPVFMYGSRVNGDRDLVPLLGLEYGGHAGEVVNMYRLYDEVYGIDEYNYPCFQSSLALGLNADKWNDYVRGFRRRWPGFSNEADAMDYAGTAMADVIARYYANCGCDIEQLDDCSFAVRFPK